MTESSAYDYGTSTNWELGAIAVDPDDPRRVAWAWEWGPFYSLDGGGRASHYEDSVWLPIFNPTGANDACDADTPHCHADVHGLCFVPNGVFPGAPGVASGLPGLLICSDGGVAWTGDLGQTAEGFDSTFNQGLLTLELTGVSVGLSAPQGFPMAAMSSQDNASMGVIDIGLAPFPIWSSEASGDTGPVLLLPPTSWPTSVAEQLAGTFAFSWGTYGSTVGGSRGAATMLSAFAIGEGAEWLYDVPAESIPGGPLLQAWNEESDAWLRPVYSAPGLSGPLAVFYVRAFYPKDPRAVPLVVGLHFGPEGGKGGTFYWRACVGSQSEPLPPLSACGSRDGSVVLYGTQAGELYSHDLKRGRSVRQEIVAQLPEPAKVIEIVFGPSDAWALLYHGHDGITGYSTLLRQDGKVWREVPGLPKDNPRYGLATDPATGDVFVSGHGLFRWSLAKGKWALPGFGWA